MTETTNWFSILITFIAALILTLLPMPEWAMWARPAWVLLLLIYWTITLPYTMSVATAWCLGLTLDVLNGTLLGEHALALTIVIYFVARIQSQFRMFPLLQQGLFVFLFVLFYQFILFCIQGVIGALPKSWLYWLPPITSMLLWPWIFVILQDLNKKK